LERWIKGSAILGCVGCLVGHLFMFLVGGKTPDQSVHLNLTTTHIVPLIHHWLMIQGQRSMRGVRMNTLGWFDFKSAWFAPPEP
ncbi:hypothetical protein, partial [Klebsiella pneumoniae]|uniref:hypothetical protein n=1 Tax=Klebsiella pneumoniae TaxID=573 RepID=UPI00159F1613